MAVDLDSVAHPAADADASSVASFDVDAVLEDLSATKNLQMAATSRSNNSGSTFDTVDALKIALVVSGVALKEVNHQVEEVIKRWERLSKFSSSNTCLGYPSPVHH